MKPLRTYTLHDKENRLRQIKFLVSTIRDGVMGGYEITTFPFSCGRIWKGKTQKDCLLVVGFIELLSQAELCAWLSARDARWDKWIETGEE